MDAAGTRRSYAQIAGQLGGSGTYPTVQGIRETAGPTLLTIGAIADGQVLQRSGSGRLGLYSPGLRHLVWHRPTQNSAFESLAGAVGTATGTTTYENTQSSGTWAVNTTVDGDGNGAGRIGGNQDKVNFGQGPAIWLRFRLGTDLANLTLWAGFYKTSSTAPSKATSYVKAHCMLRWGYGTDTNWQFSVGDGTTQSVTDLGVAPAVSVEYWLKIDASVAGQATLTLYSVTGTAPDLVITQIATATKSGNLPAGSDQVAWRYEIYNQAAGFTRFWWTGLCCWEAL